MTKYSIGEVWWVDFPYEEKCEVKHRPAIVIDEETIAILAMYVTSQDKTQASPYFIEITDWKEAGLSKASWARVDRIVKINEYEIDRKIGSLSDRDLLKLLQLVAEIQEGVFHEFALAAIQNSENEYLQVYDPGWKCWLFPYFRGTDENRENVERKLSDLFQIPINTEYISQALHCKYSVKDQVYKRYRHLLYRINMENTPSFLQNKENEVSGVKYKWMTFSEMEKDASIMEKNEEVVAFVKTKCGQK